MLRVSGFASGPPKTSGPASTNVLSACECTMWPVYSSSRSSRAPTGA